MRLILTALVKIIGVVAASFAAIFYLKLGWFWPVVGAAGGFAAVYATRKERAQTNHRAEFAAAAVAGYLILAIGSMMLMLNRKSSRTFSMTWADRGPNNEWKEPEVVLTFADHPEYYVGIVSGELSKHLAKRGDSRVDVVFEVTSAFGCMSGFHETKIGGLTRWNARWSYSGVKGNPREGRSPWGARRWWCP